jgi:YqaJ-like viral recombinase domain
MTTLPIRIADSPNRRSFIGGSDAGIIMGSDEAALLRLWREKRGEAEPEDLSTNLVVQLGLVTEPLNRHWFERNTGQVITEVQRRVQHPVIRWMAATLDGMVEQTGAVFEAKFMLPLVVFGRSGGRKTRATAPAQYVGDKRQSGGALDHHRRRQMGGDHHPGRSPLPAPPAYG